MLKIAYHPIFVHPVPEGHRFPMAKYELVPQQLMYEGTIEEKAFFKPGKIDLKYVEKVHSKEYLHDLINLKIDRRAQRKTGFEHDALLIERELTIMEGTRRAAEFALEHGVSMNISGGTHHAYSDRGEGFCLLNDNAIAAQWLLDEEKANKVLIIDLDVHQGNGTAEIFEDKEDVFTFSMHGKNNYPLKKEKSDLDVELEDGIKDKEYLYLLERSLDTVFKSFSPDFIFYQSGVDIISTDKLGRLNVSLEGCKTRDATVFNLAKSMKIPIVANMGGGYSPEIKHIVEAHSNTFRVVQQTFF